MFLLNGLVNVSVICTTTKKSKIFKISNFPVTPMPTSKIYLIISHFHIKVNLHMPTRDPANIYRKYAVLIAFPTNFFKFSSLHLLNNYVSHTIKL